MTMRIYRTIARPSALLVLALVASACSVASWGVGSYGQLGDGRADDWTLPVEADTTGATAQMDIGGNHGCVIDDAAQLWCWGRNGGNIGNGQTDDVAMPVPAGTAAWSSVSAGNQGTCGIQLDGSLWCWGSALLQFVPTQVGTDTDWDQVSFGNEVRCALKTDASLWCWGRNDLGQVGDGTNTFRSAPVQIEAGASWAEVQAGWLKTCARQTDGTLWCWGYNLWGQLGDGTTTSRNVPTQVGTSTAWTSMGTDQSGSHTCALQVAALWCWGANFYAEIGDGTTTHRSEPVPSISGAWRTASMGGVNTCAVRTDDTLWCWGGNDHGTLANGTETPNTAHPIPTQVGGAEWATVEAGQQHVCGLKLDASVWCWGSDQRSQLGNGQPDSDEPAPMAPGETWLDVGTGAEHACGITNERTLECWGRNRYGQLGLGFTSNLESARTPVDSNTWAQVTASTGDQSGHTCGIQANQTLWCWGRNSTGQLGDGTTTDQSSPVQVTGAWDTVHAADNYTCGIQADASLWCWGWSGNVRLGSPGGPTSIPRQVDPGSQWIAVAPGEDWHNCAIKADTTLWCWGGGPGAGFFDGEEGPVNVAPVQMGTATGWQDLASGARHTCAIRSDKSLWCWGENFNGQLGDGTTTYKLAPVQIDPSHDWLVVAAGNDRTCAIAQGDTPSDPNELYCWGENLPATAPNTQTTTPTLVPYATSWAIIDIGEEFIMGGGL